MFHLRAAYWLRRPIQLRMFPDTILLQLRRSSGRAVLREVRKYCSLPPPGPARNRPRPRRWRLPPTPWRITSPRHSAMSSAGYGHFFLVIRPYNHNRTVRFHAFQAIFVHVGAIVVMIVGNIVLGMMAIVDARTADRTGVPPALGVPGGEGVAGSKIVLPVAGQQAEQQA